MSDAARDAIRCVVVIQCDVARERCSGTRCVMAFTKRDKFFQGYRPDTIFVPMTCGGCPGRRVSRLMANVRHCMKQHDVTQEQIMVHLSSCVSLDSAHYPVCPNVEYISRILRRRGFQYTSGSVESDVAARRREEGRYAND